MQIASVHYVFSLLHLPSLIYLRRRRNNAPQPLGVVLFHHRARHHCATDCHCSTLHVVRPHIVWYFFAFLFLIVLCFWSTFCMFSVYFFVVFSPILEFWTWIWDYDDLWVVGRVSLFWRWCFLFFYVCNWFKHDFLWFIKIWLMEIMFR